jgi:hypothetical protein
MGLIASLRGIFYEKMCNRVFEQNLIAHIIARIVVGRDVCGDESCRRN